MSLPKVLVACPTASAKNYCLEEYIKNVMSFKYPNYDVRMYDNSKDNGKNAQHINDTFARLYSKNDEKFLCENSLVKHNFKKDSIQSVIDRMVLSHNDCRDTLLNNDYTHLLHLESDIFPTHDIIERLMVHAKRVVGAPYYRDNGRARRLCLQRRVYRSPHNILAENFLPEDDAVFLDGSLKEIAHVGLGCVLIHRSVLEKIKFRAIQGQGIHPDSYFAEDCFRNNIKIHVDTSLICEHNNEDWGVYGVDFR